MSLLYTIANSARKEWRRKNVYIQLTKCDRFLFETANVGRARCKTEEKKKTKSFYFHFLRITLSGDCERKTIVLHKFTPISDKIKTKNL